MITRIEATNYRCFEQLDVDLGELCVIVGANGAGKTTFLDIPALLVDLLNAKRISSAFLHSQGTRPPRASTLGELLHLGRGTTLAFAVEAKLPQSIVAKLLAGSRDASLGESERSPAYIRYELSMEVIDARDIQVSREHLFTFPACDRPRGFGQEGPLNANTTKREPPDPHPLWRFFLERGPDSDAVFSAEPRTLGSVTASGVDREILALPRVQFESRDAFPASRWLLDLLTRHGIFFAPDWADLRTASPPGQPKRIVADGRNLPWLALALKESARERFEGWKAHVAIALPQITDIDAVEREDDHHAYLRVTYNGNYQVTSSGLSEGTLRILALTLIPYLPEPPRLLIVEEPETGIHPRAIAAVLQSLSSVYDGQVLLSSHSPIVVAQTPVEQILAARLGDDGSVTIVPGPKHPRLAQWKGQLGLGSLFAAGVLG